MAAVTMTAVVGCVAAAFLAFGAATFFLMGDLATTGVAGAATSVVSVMVKNVLVDRSYTTGKVNTEVLVCRRRRGPLIFIKTTVPTSERVSTEFDRPVVTTLMFFTFFPKILAINAKFDVF
jgi:hypothetical protein